MSILTFWRKSKGPINLPDLSEPIEVPRGRALLESGKKLKDMTDEELGEVFGYLKNNPYLPAPLKSWAEVEALGHMIRLETHNRITCKYT